MRSAVDAPDGTVAIDHSSTTRLEPKSAARDALRAALKSPTLEDSDCFLVLHGFGGGAPRAGLEIATGMINLEHLLARGEDVRDRWVDLLPSPIDPPMARVLVSVTALEALRALQSEVENEPPPPPPPPLPAGVERWRVRVGLGGVAVRLPTEYACWYAIKLSCNGLVATTRTYKHVPDGYTSRLMVCMPAFPHSALHILSRSLHLLRSVFSRALCTCSAAAAVRLTEHVFCVRVLPLCCCVRGASPRR